MDLWIDADLAAEEEGAVDAADPRFVQCCIDAQSWVERVRFDLDLPADLTASIHRGARMYAIRLYLQRNAPVGMPAYDEFGNSVQTDMGASMAAILDHIGGRRPVIA